MKKMMITVIGSVVLTLPTFAGEITSKGSTIRPRRYKVEEQRLGGLHETILSPTSSGDGRHYAYATFKSDKCIVIVDGQLRAEYEGVGQGSLVFSPDGERFACAAMIDSRWLVDVDHHTGPQCDGIGGIVFSANGRRLIYSLKRGAGWFVAVDHKVGPKYDAVGGLTFSSDGKRVAYFAQKENKWFAVVDGELGSPYERVGTPHFSPNGKQVAYGARVDERWFMVVDSQTNAKYDGVSDPVFSPNGKRLAYAANRGERHFVVVDGREGPEYDLVMRSSLVFAPDGKRAAYAAKDGEKWFIVVGEQGRHEVNVSFTPEMHIRFSPDGKRMAYVVKQSGFTWHVDSALTSARRAPTKGFVVVDGQKEAEYASVGSKGPVFSRDSKHVAYLAGKGDKRFIVVDGEPGPQYDNVIENGPSFNSNGVLEYLAVKQKVLYRIKHVPKNK